MQTRRDLYQAHRLMMQRLGTALLQGEPDVPESPMRRHNVAMFCGVLLAVLVTAAFGIWGLIKPGGATALTEPGTLIVEEETGATYVYSERDARLLPVANYTSARLLLDTQQVTVRTVSSASLHGFSRGTLVGIPGAPDSLPRPERLVHGPWSACVAEAVEPDGTRRPYSTLVGGMDVGGRPFGPEAMIADDGQQSWMVLADRRMRVPDSVVRALAEGRDRQVPASWLNALPIGPDFRAPKIPGLGRATRGPDGRASAAGRVYKVPGVTGGGDRWYVLLRDGLATLTQTQATLLLEDPATKAAYGRAPVEPVEVDAAHANAAPRSATSLAAEGLPATMPVIGAPDRSAPLCAVYSDTGKGSTRARLTIGGRLRMPVPPAAGSDQDHFDQVLLPPGGAVLAGLLPGDGQLDAVRDYSLVTDQGRRFALASADLVARLGYGDADVAPVPAHLLHLIPEGPVLDPAAARTPVPITAADAVRP
ncbi:type VII secretion protein EccB [Sphaerisporangium krabiense]|uniref:Type VII secretion protein EccB n=1 Tax=Sphaerisporangium krabiense TaxID=763782 RepID=A0A7W8Z779_9ACTN|nr:type VII secretion protein EccB [Sphaerisporangium krabiense]MBB5628769.1 type VII secretion protein EccB [Sphaerisporangium krabiense]GII60389.1 type VII secretion protein EccB [Sphaerisporangium krabiense]